MTRSRSRQPAIPEPIAGLIDPRLAGARCRGKAPLFDDELPDEAVESRSERLTYAASLCRTCPVQSACRIAAAEQDHPIGLWAGHLHNPAGTPGRPRKASA
ncbi:WhiB family transcriptional regulator [Rhodococcus zopfii]|uniref:WhiB family transcriptional regulator n=1 Tax=Rhodococcus zopfii TaxID=43772 RepID=UPI003658DEE3